jgi:hypothetical protein
LFETQRTIKCIRLKIYVVGGAKLLSGKYLVTCQLSGSPNRSTGTLLFENSDVDRAWQLYRALLPMTGMSVALWHPDGSLIAFHAGAQGEQ